ncbi:tyrosine-protein kinase hopscotch [Thrips palmi]|uniref:Tyrosine-protein kinase n=1 Tax=Thrips palmi TaxID=161013 RepID=A0A6P8ZQX3_THRPL|nr:tyrosine-protein kinase hopscotch [Thrips palmi]
MVVVNGKSTLLVHTAVKEEPIKVSIDDTTTAEDVCIKISKDLNIGPVARYLFALRLPDKNVFLGPNILLSLLKSNAFVFRVRFKVPQPERLEAIDVGAYNYFFHQARKDFVDGEVPDISFKKRDQKKEALGLAITDMYLYKVEKGVEISAVVQDYKRFFPKEVQNHHSIFLKKPIRENLCRIEEHKLESVYIKRRWIEQFREMAPSYLTEEFTVLPGDGSEIRSLSVRVDPFNEQCPGIQVKPDGKKDWVHLCSIEDLCYVAVKFDNTVEISRKNGIPSHMKFPCISIMISFVSLLDGYYRLMTNWTFNLCKEVRTPSLQRLQSTSCHGPVGMEFSYTKLKEKRDNDPGCFLLRESESDYDVYFLDVCYDSGTKDKPKLKAKSYKINVEYHIDEEGGRQSIFILEHDNSSYSSLQELIKTHRAPGSNIWLKECLPPSEFETSMLLLCRKDSSQDDDSKRLSSAPLVIDFRTIRVSKSRYVDQSGSMLNMMHATWRQGKSKDVSVLVKTLERQHYENHPLVFSNNCDKWSSMAKNWAFLQSSCVARLLGIVINNPVSLVLEHVAFGPLDSYLKENRQVIKPIDLVEACANLASALWHLEEHGIVHGNIRCKNLLLATHDAQSFSVKLADPGLPVYTYYDIHWIPPECYHDLESAQNSPLADVWACGTTMWEIFALGDSIPDLSNVESVKKHYLSGGTLPCPPLCSQDIFQLIKECWEVDANNRKKPQAVMRDINQIFYQVFNSRRTHSYSVALPKRFKEQAEETYSISESEISMLSGATVETLLDSGGGGRVISGQTFAENISHSSESNLFGNWLLGDSQEHLLGNYETMTPNISAMLSNMTFSTVTTSLESMSSVFELGPDVNVVLQGRIGQGFYGEVYKGTLERLDSSETEQVAVKKLRSDALSTTLADFEREINIMKTLEHPNIVQIKGVVHEPEVSLVMEFVQHGSLKSYLKIHNEKLLPEKHLLKFALDVAKGMEYLGQKNIVHRDLAARNILVFDEFNVKISDFGLAQVMSQNNYYIMTSNRELPIPWYAPESLRDGKFSPRSDVWSYGVTLYEMFSLGEEPRLASCTNEQDHHELLRVLDKGDRLPCPPQCPQAVYVELMTPCWKSESRDRPSFSEICDIISSMRTLM